MKFGTKILSSAAFAMCFVGAMSPAYAEGECTFDIAQDDFEQKDIDKLYDCMKDDLAAGYAKEGDAIGSTYREWQATSTGPAAPGTHSGRFLFTFANEIGYSDYVQYRDEGDWVMPVGSVLAKESYKLSKKGKGRKGPLFIMTKVASGEADEFGNWVYSALKGNGKVMKIKQAFCHDCHQAFSDQDSMGFPDTDVRFEVE